jgi:hypothetical protein
MTSLCVPPLGSYDLNHNPLGAILDLLSFWHRASRSAFPAVLVGFNLHLRRHTPTETWHVLI